MEDYDFVEQRPIDLHTFRRVNKITQAELADFLGVTRGFVSSIENGKAKLPEDKIVLLRTKAKEEMGWDIDDLMPAYKRILVLMDLERSRLVEKGINNAELYSFHQLLGIPEKVIVNILEGKTTFTKTICELIHDKIPDINVNWLLTGVGDVYLKEKPTKNPRLPKELQKIYTELQEIKKEILELKQMLQELNTLSGVQ